MSKRIKSIEKNLGMTWLSSFGHHTGEEFQKTLTYHLNVLRALLDYLELDIIDGGLRIVPRNKKK